MITTQSRSLLLVLLMVLGGAGCAQNGTRGVYPGATESDRLDVFFERAFQKIIKRDPEEQTEIGDKGQHHLLTDRSEVYRAETLALQEALLEELKMFDYSALTSEAKVSYDLFVAEVEAFRETYEWRDYKYVVNQMHGIQSGLPSFMIGMHGVDNEKDLDAYVSRLNQFQKVLGQTVAQLKRSQKAGVMPPKFVFPKVLQDIRNLLKGRPFETSSADSTLLADFKKKMQRLKLSAAKQKAYLTKAEAALRNSVLAGYTALETALVGMEKKASTDDGVWKFPKGDDYYRYRLKKITTSNYTADFVHKLGLMNVDRIHGEMREIMKAVKFKGDLKAFFRFMMKDKQFYFPQSPTGERKYLKLANNYIDHMRGELPKMFSTLPKAKLEVRAVEAFRKESAGLAFYELPAADGSRPGAYYVNLSNLKGLPTWEAEALAHHEALPGHHMQISIAQELESLPKFRRYLGPTAYIEGWGLYSEKLPLEFGAYKDPYSNFGRLSMELWRACRLVVDTGIHDKKWTREKAIQYLADNTPSDPRENSRAIERYIVMPGQATGYMVGMLKILELRRKAKDALGDQFDLRQFHDAVLLSGAVPLNLLEKNIDGYIQKNKGQKK